MLSPPKCMIEPIGQACISLPQVKRGLIFLAIPQWRAMHCTCIVLAKWDVLDQTLVCFLPAPLVFAIAI